MSRISRFDATREVMIRAEGAVLTGQLRRPTGPPRAAVVIHCATGAPAGFYRGFAEWLVAERDCAVLTYDYRDFGTSLHRPLPQAKATMADWGLRDQAAALAALGDLVPGAPRWVVGHSLGGLMMGFHPAMEGVDRVITVASGMVHQSDHPFGFGLQARAFWSLMPPVVQALGYMPGKRFGFGADIPKGVYQDWRRWCLTRGFYLGDVGTRLPMPDPQRVTARMRIVAVEDDVWCPAPAVWRMMAIYPQALKQQLTLRPADHGLRRIGHLGAFHRANSVVWPALVD